MTGDPFSNCQVFGGSSMRHINPESIERYAKHYSKYYFLVFNYDPELLPKGWDVIVEVDGAAILNVPMATSTKSPSKEVETRATEGCVLYKIGKATVALSDFEDISGDEEAEREVIRLAKQMLGKDRGFKIIHNLREGADPAKILTGNSARFTNRTGTKMFLTVCTVS